MIVNCSLGLICKFRLATGVATWEEELELISCRNLGENAVPQAVVLGGPSEAPRTGCTDSSVAVTEEPALQGHGAAHTHVRVHLPPVLGASSLPDPEPACPRTRFWNQHFTANHRGGRVSLQKERFGGSPCGPGSQNEGSSTEREGGVCSVVQTPHLLPVSYPGSGRRGPGRVVSPLTPLLTNTPFTPRGGATPAWQD